MYFIFIIFINQKYLIIFILYTTKKYFITISPRIRKNFQNILNSTVKLTKLGLSKSLNQSRAVSDFISLSKNSNDDIINSKKIEIEFSQKYYDEKTDICSLGVFLL